MEELISYLTIICGIISIGAILIKVGKLVARVEDLEKDMKDNKPQIDQIPVIMTLLQTIQSSITKIEARDEKINAGALKQQVENNESRSKSNSDHIAKIFDKIENVNKTIGGVSGEVKQILGILSSRGQDVKRLN